MSIGNVDFTSNFNIDVNTLFIVTSYHDLCVVMTRNLFPSTIIDTLLVNAHQRRSYTLSTVFYFPQHEFSARNSIEGIIIVGTARLSFLPASFYLCFSSFLDNVW